LRKELQLQGHNKSSNSYELDSLRNQIQYLENEVQSINSEKVRIQDKLTDAISENNVNKTSLRDIEFKNNAKEEEISRLRNKLQSEEKQNDV